ncbi:MAG: SPOR domain-containing protein [Betaproteobacteria bacterium]|nr:SPOR domain-containing protein [Betaproteobacteria bacterium]
MSRSIELEEIAFRRRARRRLIGAVAVAVAAVVFLPMVLDKEPPAVHSPIVIKMPSQQVQTVEPAVAPSGPQPADAPRPALATPAASGPAPVERARPVAVDAPAVHAARPRTPDRAPRDAPATARAGTHAAKPAKPVERVRRAMSAHGSPPAAAHPGRFAVQVGVFADARHVSRLRSSLSSHGIRSYVEEIKTAHGAATRVRTGPYQTRAEAQRAAQAVKAAGFNAVVETLP